MSGRVVVARRHDHAETTFESAELERCVIARIRPGPSGIELVAREVVVELCAGERRTNANDECGKEGVSGRSARHCGLLELFLSGDIIT